MKIWLTEVIDPSKPHTDYVVANSLHEARAIAARMGNIRVIGRSGRDDRLSAHALLVFVSGLAHGPIAWTKDAEARLDAYLKEASP